MDQLRDRGSEPAPAGAASAASAGQPATSPTATVLPPVARSAAQPAAGAVAPTAGNRLQRVLRARLRAVRVGWRTAVRPRWHEWRPAVLLGMGVSVLVLGTIGYSELPGQNYDFFDASYRAIALFGLGGTVSHPVPVPLQIARLLGPILTGYAALGTLLALTREQARAAGIRLFVRDHVVIAGLGATGWRLANDLIEREPVVAIEADPTHERLPGARAKGIRVLIGQAGEPVLLRRAGLRHARALVVGCGDDGRNVEVAVAAAKLAEGRRDPLTVFVHLDDLDMWSSLSAEGPAFGFARSAVRIEYFNIFATGAQLILESATPGGMDAGDDTPWRPHILMVGLEGVGEQLLLQIARLWRSLGPGPEDRLRITVTGPNAEHEVAVLLQRYPSLEDYASLVTRQLAIESEEFQSGSVMLPEDGWAVTQAYVCLQDDGDALIAGLALHAKAPAATVPVTVAVEDDAKGIGIVLQPNVGRFANITPFGLVAATTTGDLLLRGTTELLARAQHTQWLAHEEKSYRSGKVATRNANAVPWERLDEAVREDNRRFADDLQEKLRLIDAMLVPQPLPPAAEPEFTFTSAELEMLAEHEHRRWMDSKQRDGWRYGPVRDNDKKIHDQLKPYAELDVVNKDKDRDAVRELPHMLELAGFKIQRNREVLGSR